MSAHAHDPVEDEPARQFLHQPWAKWARCQEVGGDWHFPEASQSAAVARSICRHCEVCQECLEWALITDERYGVWGGLTPKERRNLEPSRIIACPDCDARFATVRDLNNHTRTTHRDKP
jgi:WhiB family redox-sensing transcriptional regulator